MKYGKPYIYVEETSEEKLFSLKFGLAMFCVSMAFAAFLTVLYLFHESNGYLRQPVTKSLEITGEL